MRCEFCPAEAVERCYTCGGLFCPDHGKLDCQRCRTAIAPGDRRVDRISAVRLAPVGRAAWWRPQPAEDYDPPACHVCGGLARRTCPNCQHLYCPEHAGKHGLCVHCFRSAQIGAWILWGLLAMMAVFVVLGLVM